MSFLPIYAEQSQILSHPAGKHIFCTQHTYHYQTQLIFVIQLFIGFGTSIVMLVTVIFLIQRSYGDMHAGVDNTGILQTMWIAYNHPELQADFLQVVEPTTDNLRSMGMFETQLAEVPTSR